MGRVTEADVIADLARCQYVKADMWRRWAYGKREMREVLEEHRHGVPEVSEFERAYVLSVEKDLALLGIVQSDT